MAATSFARVGHASALTEKFAWLPQLILSVHLLAIAFWLGALWPLQNSSRHASRPAGSNDAGAPVARLMQRFGRLAVFVVGLLVSLGMVLLWMLLGSLQELWTTAYGQMMLLKLMAVGALLGLAALNKLRLTPRLLAQDRHAIERTLKQLRRSIQLEMSVAVLILFITASFTTLVGPAALA